MTDNKKSLNDLDQIQGNLGDNDLLLVVDISDKTESSQGTTKTIRGSLLDRLKPSNNLSDVTDKQTAVNNLLETTNSEDGQVIGSDGTNAAWTNQAQINRPITTESSTSRSLTLTDKNTIIRCTNSSPTTITIPLDSSVAYDTGNSIEIYRSLGAGEVTVQAPSGVTLNGVDNGSAVISAENNTLEIIKINTNAWEALYNVASSSLSFDDLTDTPSSKTNNAKIPLSINDAETEIEYDREILYRRPVITETTTYRALSLTDGESLIVCNNSSGAFILIPPQSFTNFPINTQIEIVRASTATSSITIEGDMGVTVNGSVSGSLEMDQESSAALILKTGSDTWEVFYN
jgi:hypothetical protein